MLTLMNRGYTSGQYYDFIARARDYMPDICLAGDFIVGFPTETDEDFAATIQLVKDCRFKNSFIFKYSPRPGTIAIDRFVDDVPEDVKRHRNNDLLAVQQEASAANNRAMVGKTVEVLVEGESKLVSRREANGGIELGWEKRTAPARRMQMVGRTRGDQVVVFDADSSLKGQLLDVEIISSQSLTLFGRLAAVPVAAEAIAE
jgi:tRNA-2-methylthio-N6-dimethylallyladenosine synthase